MPQPMSMQTNREITVNKMLDLHALGVFLSMYWLKSSRNWVLLSDNFSSLQYSLRKTVLISINLNRLLYVC